MRARSAEAVSERLQRAVGYQLWPTSTGSGCSAMPKRCSTPAGDLVGERHQLRRRRAAAVDERERVLGRDAGAAVAVALVEARLLDQPRRRGLDAAVGLGPRRRSPGGAGSRIGLVKNEPALTESGSLGSITMPLPRRSCEHRRADVGERRAAAGSDVQLARELGVPSGPDVVLSRRRNVTLSTTRRSWYLKMLRAVDEAALVRAHLCDRAGLAVEHLDRLDGLGDLLPVRADVLDRRRADRAGDPGQALEALQALARRSARRASSQSSPAATVSVVPSRATPRVAIRTTVPSTPASAITTFEPPAITSAASRGLLDQLRLLVDLHERGRRAAELQRRQLGEFHTTGPAVSTCDPSGRPSTSCAAARGLDAASRARCRSRCPSRAASTRDPRWRCCRSPRAAPGSHRARRSSTRSSSRPRPAPPARSPAPARACCGSAR